MNRALRTFSVFAALAGCGAPPVADPEGAGAEATGQADLPLGDVAGGVGGSWGYATQCKSLPNLPALVNPRITVSINGLTLHLVDPTTGYDRVFPVGVGAIETTSTSANYGESKTHEPLLGGKSDFTITQAGMTACKIWWTDPVQGSKEPVFAGLPFMSWNGPYAIHGPVDNYRAANGGNLRRGYVSHGCVRMEAADVSEIYARIHTVRAIPVHVQREPERLSDGTRADVATRWIGAECQVDGDCNYTGGKCKLNRYAQRGFCTAACTSTCADMPGQPTTFCVADPDDKTQGICVPKMIAQDQDCRPYDHLIAKSTTRFKQSVVSTVCVPGSPGWVGDHCFANSECKNGTTCIAAAGGQPGICSETCSHYCADMPGWTDTFCADDPDLGPGCVRRCTPASNASECPADSDCVSRNRPNGYAGSAWVCIPHI